MKRMFILLLFVFTSLPSFSQTNSGNEINAEGNSKVKVKPDLASLSISVEKQNLVQKNAIKDLNEEMDKIQKILLKIGFTEKNIKIAEYEISSNQNDNNEKEYTVTNTLMIRFALDNKIIEDFYQGIQNENIKDSDIDFNTYLSEELEKTTRKKLVQLAILDAKVNAENIAQALDVKINTVKQVSKYNTRDLVAASYKADNVKFDRTAAAAYVNPKTSFDKFEVEEIELEETITIVYEIVKK